MKLSKLRSMTLLALAAGMACIAPAARAATSAEGDLFLGFRATAGTGLTKNVIVNVGSFSQFTSGSGATTLSLGSVGTGLDSIYGAGWSARTDLFWGVVGATSAFTTLGSEPANTLFATRPRLVPATPVAPWTRQSATTQGSTLSKISSMRTAFNGSTALAGPTNGVEQLKLGVNSWGSYQTGGTVINSGPAPGTAFAAWNATIDTTPAATLDLFRLRPSTASAPAGTLGDYLGSFTLSNTGALTFTPVITPFVTLNNQTVSVLESVGTLSITITREGDITNTSSVLVSTVNGTAISGTDFTGLTNQLIEFAENEATQNISIPITNRAGINGSRTFSVSMNTPIGATLGSSFSAQVTITESESSFAFASATYSAIESGGNAVVTINRTGRTDVANNVTLNTANGSAVSGTDYTAQSNVTVAFAANQTSRTASIPLVNRAGVRANRDFTATLTVAGSPLLVGAPATTTVTITEADSVSKGATSTETPYLLPINPTTWQTTSLLTVGNGVPGTGGAGTYQMCGIADGLGAYDNNNGTFTLLMHHELGNTVGSARAHGGIGAFISEWIINKSTLSVVSGKDLITTIIGWDSGLQAVGSALSNVAMNRLCSADLPPVSAFYNATSGLGTQNRLFMGGEEGGSFGWVFGNVATGPDKGKSYILGKFNRATNGSGSTDVGGWENIVANPHVQNKTVVIGLNDGGTGIMNNSVSLYVGTKTNSGTDVDKAGLTNGTLTFINVTGSTAEIVNTTTRATNITSGTAFTLSATASTTFSRPEDGAWDTTNAARFYFVTTDRLDQVADGIGAQIGRTRLWRLNFSDITDPALGGTIDLLVQGGVGNDANMWDNLGITPDGKLLLQEDVGGAPHLGKVWMFDPSTSTLTKVLTHDPARFGNIVSGSGVAATAPFNNDEESSGIIDVTSLLGGNTAAGDRMFLTVVQAHYSIVAPFVEGGQLLLVNTVTPYSLWRQQYYTNVIGSGLTANDADFDGDGISNILEYALGLNPTLATGANGIAGLPTGSTSETDGLLNDRLTLSLLLDSPTPADITMTVQSTSDLSSWTNVARKIGTGVWSWLPGGTPRVVHSAVGPRTNTKVGDNLPAAGNPTRMMRLNVTTP